MSNVNGVLKAFSISKDDVLLGVLAESSGEVPVGAVIAHAGTIIARGHNTTEADKSVIAHAELPKCVQLHLEQVVFPDPV